MNKVHHFIINKTDERTRIAFYECIKDPRYCKIQVEETEVIENNKKKIEFTIKNLSEKEIIRLSSQMHNFIWKK